eukprot:scaffold741_cov336-Pavlova_lutheri.AAC.13
MHASLISFQGEPACLPCVLPSSSKKVPRLATKNPPPQSGSSRSPFSLLKSEKRQDRTDDPELTAAGFEPAPFRTSA